MKTVAIVGASENRRKFGNKAVRAFLDDGWKVYPVHPNASEIEGIAAVPTLADIPGHLDRISMYLPPDKGLTLLPEIARRDPDEVFFNPGSESPEIIAEAHKLGVSAVLACSVVDIGLTPEDYSDE